MRNKLVERVEEIETGLRVATVASCNCDHPANISPKPQAHELSCRYRVLYRAADKLADIRLALAAYDTDDLFNAIKHGDDEHRAWLKEAIEAHFAGQPVPQSRGKGSKEARLADTDDRIKELREALDRQTAKRVRGEIGSAEVTFRFRRLADAHRFDKALSALKGGA